VVIFPRGFTVRFLRISEAIYTAWFASATMVVEAPIVIEVGNACIGVRRGFDREVLRAILDVLGAAR